MLKQIFLMTRLMLWAGLMLCFSAQATDPTRPPIWLNTAPAQATPVAPQTLNLQQILVRDQQRYAVINDEIVTVGDRIQQATVVAIRQSSVTLKTTKSRFVLSLLESSSISGADAAAIKKPAVSQQSENYGK
ncbi:hypothetical protein [Bacterioplanoides sp.]|uniref:hypothetical protein n=1 Tax=Bacterioplanoides sp. TaxID=2066072 RepID=UPI003B00A074